MSNSTRLVHQVSEAAVRATGRRWCQSCGVHHQADQMQPRRLASGGVIYRCQKWIEAHAKRKATVTC